MTNRISVIEKPTVRKRMKQGIAIGLVALVTGIGIGSANYYLKSKEHAKKEKIEQAKKEKAYQSNVEEVDILIETKKYDFAKELLDGFEKEKILKQDDIQKLRVRIRRLENYNKVEEINKAVEEKDFPLAALLLDQFEKENTINTIDIQSLRLEMKRQKGVSNLKRLISKYDFENAKKLLSELEVSDMYSLEQIEAFERYVENISPKGLVKRIMEAEEQDMIKLCREYLSVYPKEKETSKVVERLLMQEFKDLTQKLKEKELIKKVMNLTQELNDDIEKYKHIKTDISKIIGQEGFKQTIEAYITKKEEEKYEGSSEGVTIGVKVRVAENFLGRWGNDNYVNTRTTLFPIGTEGIVLKSWESGDVLVEFDKNKTYNWPNEVYSFTDEWKARGHKGIARFDPRELEVVKNPVSPIDIQKLRIESGRVIKNLQE